MQIKQVINETDWMDAICEYMIEQLDGRFRLQFPGLTEKIDDLLLVLNDPLVRTSDATMIMGLGSIVGEHGARLTIHSLTGCSNTEGHAFQRELINLVWSARYETLTWLNQQGVVPGQSCN